MIKLITGAAAGCALIFSLPVNALEPREVETTVDVSVSSKLFATRGDGMVTQADFDAHLSRVPEHHRALLLSDPERIGRILENLMLPRQIVAHAREDGFTDNELLNALLYQSSIVLTAERYLDELWQRERLDDYEGLARELFLTRKDLIGGDEQFDFSHILISATAGGGELDAMKSVLAVYERLEAGAGLDELAAEFSDDRSDDDARIRYEGVAGTELDEEVARVLSLLSPGQISEPFKSAHGWHIVELHDRYRPDVTDFDAVRDRALEMAESRHRSEHRDRFLASLSAEGLELADGAVAELLERYPAEQGDTDRIMQELQGRMD